MGLYSNWNHAAAHHQPSVVDRARWRSSCGGRIMQACHTAGHDHTTLVGMRAIVAEFQNVGWTWNPSTAGRGAGAGRTWLDRQAAGAGECGFVGAALAELLMTPQPYGFGLARGQPASPATAVYNGGGGGWGFLADHVGLHHGLTANVSDPANPLVLSPLYYWGDHVVVDYLNRFWDPSYNTDYANLADMAAYTVVNTDWRGASGDLAFQMRPRGGGGPDVWFRSARPADLAHVHAQCRMLGPYANNPLPPLAVVAVGPPSRCCECIIL